MHTINGVTGGLGDSPRGPRLQQGGRMLWPGSSRAALSRSVALFWSSWLWLSRAAEAEAEVAEVAFAAAEAVVAAAYGVVEAVGSVVVVAAAFAAAD